jgi:hypothetical protein
MEGSGSAAAHSGGDPFAALPHALLLRVFARVPVQQRLRCAEVCRGWRATLGDTTLWTELDLRRCVGDARGCSAALLHAAAARAGGRLRMLRLDSVQLGVLCAVAAANAASLCVLQLLDTLLSCAEVEALLLAAPQLRVLETELACNGEEEARSARALLRGEGLPPQCQCSVRVLFLWLDQLGADALGLAADLAAHGWTRKLTLNRAELSRATLDAVVDAALACRMTHIRLYECDLSPACAPALVRLLAGNAVAQLAVDNIAERQLLDTAAAALLRDALQANTSLTSLTLRAVLLWQNATAAALLFGALVGHPRLRALDVSWNGTQGCEARRHTAGAALAQLLHANAPALLALRCNECSLTDTGVAPLCTALAHNTHLHTLDCSANYVSAAFARDVLLPDVRANTSLRELLVDADEPSSEEAMAHVAARN